MVQIKGVMPRLRISASFSEEKIPFDIAHLQADKRRSVRKAKKKQPKFIQKTIGAHQKSPPTTVLFPNLHCNNVYYIFRVIFL